MAAIKLFKYIFQNLQEKQQQTQHAYVFQKDENTVSVINSSKFP